MNRYNEQQSKVTPATPGQAYPITAAQAKRLEGMQQNRAPIVMPDQAFNPQATTTESATPIERSKALIVRLAPVTLIYLVLSVSIAIVLSVDLAWAFVVFAALTALSYYNMDASERYDSATGVEHQREITQTYIKFLGGDQ